MRKSSYLGPALAVVCLAGAASAEDGAGLVADLKAVVGEHHARPAHAKGIVVEGSFTPAAEARGLSTAAIFAAGPVPLIGRFSNSGGLPDGADPAPGTSPRGFAFRLDADGDAPMDVVMHSFNGFPVATADEFGALFRAIAASGPDAAKPTELERFLAEHPKAAAFLGEQAGPPESFATLAYFGVNAFDFANAAGDRTTVRYRLVPRAGIRLLEPAAAATAGHDYLGDEIAARLADGPVTFDWLAQIAAPGDRADDPSTPWPEDRQLVPLGTVEIVGLSDDQAGQDVALAFLPGITPEGIEPADPMLGLRDEAYAVSAAARQ